MTSPLVVKTQDGFALAATSYGDARTCNAGVIIVAAMGVEQHYYAAFAQHLAHAGYWVMTFDYRGMGASRPAQFKRSLRGFEANVRTWAERDCAAVAPREVGENRIGHFGFFRKRFALTLWPTALQWLAQHHSFRSP